LFSRNPKEDWHRIAEAPVYVVRPPNRPARK